MMSFNFIVVAVVFMTSKQDGRVAALPDIAAVAATIPEVAKCAEASKCGVEAKTMKELEEKNAADKLCPIHEATIKCMASSVQDCKDSNVLNAEQLKSYTDSFEQGKQMLEQLCPGKQEGGDAAQSDIDKQEAEDAAKRDIAAKVAAFPKTVGCKETSKCAIAGQEMAEWKANKEFYKFCPLLGAYVNCLRISLQDCKDNNVLNAEDLQSTEMTYTGMEKVFNTDCPDYQIVSNDKTEGESDGKDGGTACEVNPNANAQQNTGDGNDGDGASTVTQTTLILAVSSVLSLLVAHL